MFAKKKKIGLALGGGAARGLSYIGVFRALKENNVPIDFVAGTSVGSLAGAFYCADISIEKMTQIVKSITMKNIKTGLLPIIPSKTDGIQKVVKQHLGDISIEELPIPFCAVTTDMKQGEEVDFYQGKLAPIIAGSCCVPGFFTAVKYEEYILMDGGLLNNIPARVARDNGCDVVIAIDINSTRGSGVSSTNVFDCLKASIGIILKTNARDGYKYADIVIQPDLKRFRSTKLEGIDEMIEEGYLATMARMDEIKQLIGKKQLKRYEKQQRRNQQKTADQS